MPQLIFYTRPFRKDQWNDVWDAKGNLVFRLLNMGNLEAERILFRLNALDKNNEEITDYILEFQPITANKQFIVIKAFGLDFISIQAWNNLDERRRQHFSNEQGNEIQNDLAQWLVERLSRE